MAEISGKLKADTPATVAGDVPVAEKKTRKPRDTSKPRVGYFLGHVDENGKIIVDKFSRNAQQLLVAMDQFTREGKNVQLVTFTAD